MKLLIDINGNAGFDEWFNERDADKLLKILNDAHFNIKKESVDYEFKRIPKLKKKDVYDKIPLNSRNIFLILSHADEANDDILEILGIERESGFVITTIIRRLQGEYIKWQKIDHKRQWKDEEERLKAFSNYWESVATKSDNKIIKLIDLMAEGGCKQLNSQDEGRFPECQNQFNSNCLTCQFGKKFIKSEEEIERFNIVLSRAYED